MVRMREKRTISGDLTCQLFEKKSLGPIHRWVDNIEHYVRDLGLEKTWKGFHLTLIN